MHAPDILLNRAAECERMAEFAGDPGSKATWRRMAERWHRCAAAATTSANSAEIRHDNRHRKPAPDRAVHY
jgi:hypothetical protein